MVINRYGQKNSRKQHKFILWNEVLPKLVLIYALLLKVFKYQEDRLFVAIILQLFITLSVNTKTGAKTLKHVNIVPLLFQMPKWTFETHVPDNRFASYFLLPLPRSASCGIVTPCININRQKIINITGSLAKETNSNFMIILFS